MFAVEVNTKCEYTAIPREDLRVADKPVTEMEVKTVSYRTERRGSVDYVTEELEKAGGQVSLPPDQVVGRREGEKAGVDSVAATTPEVTRVQVHETKVRYLQVPGQEPIEIESITGEQKTVPAFERRESAVPFAERDKKPDGGGGAEEQPHPLGSSPSVTLLSAVAEQSSMPPAQDADDTEPKPEAVPVAPAVAGPPPAALEQMPHHIRHRMRHRRAHEHATRHTHTSGVSTTSSSSSPYPMSIYSHPSLTCSSSFYSPSTSVSSAMPPYPVHRYGVSSSSASTTSSAFSSIFPDKAAYEMEMARIREKAGISSVPKMHRAPHHYHPRHPHHKHYVHRGIRREEQLNETEQGTSGTEESTPSPPIAPDFLWKNGKHGRHPAIKRVYEGGTPSPELSEYSTAQSGSITSDSAVAPVGRYRQHLRAHTDTDVVSSLHIPVQVLPEGSLLGATKLFTDFSSSEAEAIGDLFGTPISFASPESGVSAVEIDHPEVMSPPLSVQSAASARISEITTHADVAEITPAPMKTETLDRERSESAETAEKLVEMTGFQGEVVSQPQKVVSSPRRDVGGDVVQKKEMVPKDITTKEDATTKGMHKKRDSLTLGISDDTGEASAASRGTEKEAKEPIPMLPHLRKRYQIPMDMDHRTTLSDIPITKHGILHDSSADSGVLDIAAERQASNQKVTKYHYQSGKGYVVPTRQVLSVSHVSRGDKGGRLSAPSPPTEIKYPTVNASKPDTNIITATPSAPAPISVPAATEATETEAAPPSAATALTTTMPAVLSAVATATSSVGAMSPITAAAATAEVLAQVPPVSLPIPSSAAPSAAVPYGSVVPDIRTPAHQVPTPSFPRDMNPFARSTPKQHQFSPIPRIRQLSGGTSVHATSTASAMGSIVTPVETPPVVVAASTPRPPSSTAIAPPVVSSPSPLHPLQEQQYQQQQQKAPASAIASHALRVQPKQSEVGDAVLESRKPLQMSPPPVPHPLIQAARVVVDSSPLTLSRVPLEEVREEKDEEKDEEKVEEKVEEKEREDMEEGGGKSIAVSRKGVEKCVEWVDIIESTKERKGKEREEKEDEEAGTFEVKTSDEVPTVIDYGEQIQRHMYMTAITPKELGKLSLSGDLTETILLLDRLKYTDAHTISDATVLYRDLENTDTTSVSSIETPPTHRIFPATTTTPGSAATSTYTPTASAYTPLSGGDGGTTAKVGDEKSRFFEKRMTPGGSSFALPFTYHPSKLRPPHLTAASGTPQMPHAVHASLPDLDVLRRGGVLLFRDGRVQHAAAAASGADRSWGMDAHRETKRYSDMDARVMQSGMRDLRAAAVASAYEDRSGPIVIEPPSATARVRSEQGVVIAAVQHPVMGYKERKEAETAPQAPQPPQPPQGERSLSPAVRVVRPEHKESWLEAKEGEKPDLAEAKQLEVPYVPPYVPPSPRRRVYSPDYYEAKGRDLYEYKLAESANEESLLPMPRTLSKADQKLKHGYTTATTARVVEFDTVPNDDLPVDHAAKTTTTTTSILSGSSIVGTAGEREHVRRTHMVSRAQEGPIQEILLPGNKSISPLITELEAFYPDVFIPRMLDVTAPGAVPPAGVASALPPIAPEVAPGLVLDGIVGDIAEASRVGALHAVAPTEVTLKRSITESMEPAQAAKEKTGESPAAKRYRRSDSERPASKDHRESIAAAEMPSTMDAVADSLASRVAREAQKVQQRARGLLGSEFQHPSVLRRQVAGEISEEEAEMEVVTDVDGRVARSGSGSGKTGVHATCEGDYGASAYPALHSHTHGTVYWGKQVLPPPPLSPSYYARKEADAEADNEMEGRQQSGLQK